VHAKGDENSGTRHRYERRDQNHEAVSQGENKDGRPGGTQYLIKQEKKQKTGRPGTSSRLFLHFMRITSFPGYEEVVRSQG
jgi:hypothetical protein